MSFQQWIDVIKLTVLREFVPSLTPHRMVIPVTEFNAASPGDTPYNLVNIADFNSLIAQSQKHSTPVFALIDAQIEQAGVILATMRDSRDQFRTAFDGLAHTVATIARI